MSATTQFFAQPTFDDSGWRTQPLYLNGSWQARGAGFFDRWLWLRVHLSPETLAQFEDPAIAFDGLLYAVTYFNGVEIGRHGVIDAPLGNLRYTQPKAVPQVYQLPKHLIQRDGPNVLSLKMGSGSLEITGIVHPNVFLDEYQAATEATRARALALLLLGTIPAFVFALAVIVSAAAWAFAPKGSGLGWLVVATTVFLPLVLLDSVPAFYLALDLPLLIYPNLAHLLGALVLVPILEFCAIILRLNAKCRAASFRQAWLRRYSGPTSTEVTRFPSARLAF